MRLLRSPLLWSLLLGAIAALGFAPLDLWPLTLAALALWMRLVHDAPTLRRVLAVGWGFGVGHFAIANNWIQHAFDLQDKMPPALGYLAVVLVALYLAVYPMLAAGAAWRLASPRAAGDAAARPGGAFVAVFAAAWIVAEWLRATMFTGYAWDPLGVAWLPVIGVARLGAWIGTYALSGVTVLAAGALLLLVGERRWRLAAGVAVPLVSAAILLAPPRAPPGDPGRRIRVVQPNVGQDAVRAPDYARRILLTMAALSERPGPVPRLVVWPEGSVDPFIEDGYPASWYFRGYPGPTRAIIARALGPRDRALVGGSALFFDSAGEVSGAGNAIFVVGPDARLGGRYDKAHLVPYGEYLPMRALLEPIGLSRLVAGEIDFVPGPGPRTLSVPGFGAIGMQICYEIIFSGQVVDRAHRPALLFNPSNDGWFGAWGPPQHLAQARMRAIEEGLPVVRSTPDGISAVIAADGRVLGTVPRHIAGAIELPMPSALPPTLFSRTGNWMAGFAVLMLLALAAALRRR